MIDEDEVQDLSIGCNHLQAVVAWNEEKFFGIIGYCDCKTFENLPYKADAEKKFEDFSKEGTDLKYLLGLLALCTWVFGSPKEEKVANKTADMGS